MCIESDGYLNLKGGNTLFINTGGNTDPHWRRSCVSKLIFQQHVWQE